MNFKNLAMWAVIVFLTIGLYNMFKNPQGSIAQKNNIIFSEFLSEVENGRVVQVEIQGNRIKGLPYKLGGGHRRINDNGYDCSGAVSYVLIKAGLLGSPLTSNGFKKYGRRGKGDWVTIYAKNGHTFLVVGGLRFDTGNNGEGRGPKWTVHDRPTRGHIIRHPVGL